MPKLPLQHLTTWTRPMRLYLCLVLLLLHFLCDITLLHSQQLVFPQYPKSVEFASVRCGSTICTNVVGYLKSNKDTTITISQARLLGSNNFSLVNPQLPSVLSSKDSLVFRICYKPNKTGIRDTSFLEVRLSPTSTQRIMLLGNSVSPILFSSQSLIQFSALNLNERECKTISLYNAGDDTLFNPILNLTAPFSSRIIGKSILPPKDSTTLEVCFQPTSVNVFSTRDSIVYSTCQPSLVLTISGACVGTAVPLLGGSLQLTPSPVNFDTTLCKTTKCITFQLKNTGSQYSIIKRIDRNVSSPFIMTDTDINTNDTLSIDSVRRMTICYTPDGTTPIDRDTIIFRADTRQSLNIAMLFDRSGSMDDPISRTDPTIRITAAKTSGINFINQLVVDRERGIVDTIAIQSFASNTLFVTRFSIEQPFTTNKNRCITAINSLNASGGTCLYDAIVSSSNSLNRKSNPVIVLLSDGDNQCNNSSTSLASSINAALANNVKVFVVCIADTTLQANKNYVAELQQIADRTGGLLYAITEAKALDDAYADIAKQLTTNTTFRIPIVGRSASPNLTISPTPLVFDSIRIYNRQCKPVTIRNSGNASVFIEPSAFSITNSDFKVDTVSLPKGILKPNESRVVDVCFTPTRLRRQSTASNEISNLCNAPTQFVLEGTGYDSIVVRFTTNVTSRSGDTVILPLILQDSVPKHYGIDSLKLTIEYQSTMLDTIGTVFDITKGTAQTLVSRSTTNSLILGDTMKVEYKAFGNSISQETLSNTLLDTRLLMLEPSVVSTTITITNLKFADGNPKVGIIQPSIVNLDPSCFSHKRLLNTKRRRAQRTQLLMIKANNGSLEGTFSSDTDSPIPSALSVYDMNGRKVCGFSLTINDKITNFSYPISLVNGIYTCVITSNEETEPICTSLMYVVD